MAMITSACKSNNKHLKDRDHYPDSHHNKACSGYYSKTSAL